MFNAWFRSSFILIRDPVTFAALCLSPRGSTNPRTLVVFFIPLFGGLRISENPNREMVIRASRRKNNIGAGVGNSGGAAEQQIWLQGGHAPLQRKVGRKGLEYISGSQHVSTFRREKSTVIKYIIRAESLYIIRIGNVWVPHLTRIYTLRIFDRVDGSDAKVLLFWKYYE